MLCPTTSSRMRFCRLMFPPRSSPDSSISPASAGCHRSRRWFCRCSLLLPSGLGEFLNSVYVSIFFHFSWNFRVMIEGRFNCVFLKNVWFFWKFWDYEFVSKVSILMFLFGHITHGRYLFISYEVELQSELLKIWIGNFLSGFGFRLLRNEKEVTDNYYLLWLI